MSKIFYILFLFISFSQAHFLTFLSNSDNIENQSDSKLEFDISFIHPFEQNGMNMEKPTLYVNSKSTNIKLTETTKLNHKAWKATYDINMPGVYKFFIEPQAYFEPSEGKFIIHVPKLIVSSFGLEEGWAEPLGLKYEIIPMVKPFSLYAGNLFQGKVLHKGKAASNIDVEVELYNEFGLKAPTQAHITQVIKTDDNGIFSFVMNHKGWWGFAALIEEGSLKHNDGESYPVENGALIWIKAY